MLFKSYDRFIIKRVKLHLPMMMLGREIKRLQRKRILHFLPGKLHSLNTTKIFHASLQLQLKIVKKKFMKLHSFTTKLIRLVVTKLRSIWSLRSDSLK